MNYPILINLYPLALPRVRITHNTTIFMHRQKIYHMIVNLPGQVPIKYEEFSEIFERLKEEKFENYIHSDLANICNFMIS
jgi:hypothetical protein